MKNTIAIIIALILSMGISTSLSAQKNKDKDFFEVRVDGLGCPFCAYGLEKKIKEFKGIKKIKIDMETGHLSFLYPADKALTLKDVEDKVDKAGYTAVNSKVTRADGSIEESKLEIDKDVDMDALTKATIYVEGVCGMCRARIKKVTRGIKGVTEADWDEDTKILTVKFDPKLTTISVIEQGLAKAGHDTKNVKADDVVYESLPGCCQYDRIKYKKS